ncbi:MAG: hypothetical protein AAGC64_13825 [Bacteroidota bacterium]
METSLQSPQEIKAFIVATIQDELKKTRTSSFSGIDKELLERMVRVEEELKLIHIRFDDHLAFIKERFEAVDKRFEAVDKRFEDNLAFNKERFEAIDRRFEAVDKRFEAVDKRFDRQDRNMKWLIGFAIAFLTLIMSFYKFII